MWILKRSSGSVDFDGLFPTERVCCLEIFSDVQTLTLLELFQKSLTVWPPYTSTFEIHHERNESIIVNHDDNRNNLVLLEPLSAKVFDAKMRRPLNTIRVGQFSLYPNFTRFGFVFLDDRITPLIVGPPGIIETICVFNKNFF